ncbi:MAG: phosphatidate cytidylyltransferase [Micropepsaceae bacterium]
MTTVSPNRSSSLWPRIITSIILIPSALAAVYAGGWILAVWASAAGLAMAREWIRIVHREDSPGWRLALHAVAILASQVLLIFGRMDYALASIFLAALLGNVLAMRQEERSIWTVMGILFIALPCLAFSNLRMLTPFGLETVIWLLCIVWATDSAAYLAGSTFGGPKLAPRISPNKTWVGAISGLGAGIAAGILLTQLTGFVARENYVAACALVSMLTQCGDLAESFLKRTFGVKDASDLIPGHGGALDRLDGMIVATSGVALLVSIYGQSPVLWAVP